MGFDIFIEVSGTCTLKKFIKANLSEIKIETTEHKINLDEINEITFDNYLIKVNDDEQTTLVFLTTLLARIKNEEDISEYLSLLSNIDNLEVDDQEVKITVLYKSSYKGSEEVKIDFVKVAEDIKLVEYLYDIEFDTKLGMG